MIIWLPSYPKSGNTFMRSILSTYFFSQDGIFSFDKLKKIYQFPTNKVFSDINVDISNDLDILKNYRNAQKHLDYKKNSIQFVKTHSALIKIDGEKFIDPEHTLGAIYIVRDPRNVITSFSNHYSKNLDESFKIMENEKTILPKTVSNSKTYLCSWKTHYKSWKNLNKNYLLVKYEDLIIQPKNSILRVLKFIDSITGQEFNPDLKKLEKVIETTHFDRVKDLESKNSFHEAPIDKITKKRKVFFNMGKDNKWEKILDKNLVSKINSAFKDEMTEIGYI